MLDTDTKLLWLYDWSISGTKTWEDAKTWAADLTVGGATDWRLPEIGEYADLWTDVGSSLLGLRSKFNPVQAYGYWSATEVAPYARYFNSSNGSQFNDFKTTALYAVAVRPGAVPEPQTLALALLALGATVVARRRRAH